jgi:hypothetical protein
MKKDAVTKKYQILVEILEIREISRDYSREKIWQDV